MKLQTKVDARNTVLQALVDVLQTAANSLQDHGSITALTHFNYMETKANSMRPSPLKFDSRSLQFLESFCLNTMPQPGQRPLRLVHSILNQKNGGGTKMYQTHQSSQSGFFSAISCVRHPLHSQAATVKSKVSSLSPLMP